MRRAGPYRRDSSRRLHRDPGPLPTGHAAAAHATAETAPRDPPRRLRHGHPPQGRGLRCRAGRTLTLESSTARFSRILWRLDPESWLRRGLKLLRIQNDVLDALAQVRVGDVNQAVGGLYDGGIRILARLVFEGQDDVPVLAVS